MSGFLVQNNVPNSENLVRDITCKLNLYKDSEIMGYVSKEDLEGMDFNCFNVDEGDLQDIAGKMMGSFTDCLYWESLRTIAEDMGIPNKKEIRESIWKMYDEYVAENGKEPTYACCSIQFKGESSEEYTIKLNTECDEDSEEDNEIFFYCNGINSLLKMIDEDADEWVLIEVFSFE